MEKEIIKSHTDLPQSKKLAEILPLDSADMYYFLDPTPAGNIYHLTVQRVDVGIKNLPQYDEGDIPCWSLAALLGVLPKIGAEEPMVIKLYYAKEPKERYICEYGLTNITSEYDNPVDACYEMILKLHELNLL